jgi:REP element-mobilizing transposase RayT
MITRRCSERRFFLRPDRDTNNAFVYCLGLAARRANVQVLFVVAMSNHYHAGIHDPDGNFPVFAEHFHALLARCQNNHLGRFESFWSSDPTSAVRLVAPADLLDKMVYAYSNPVAADLVDAIDDWPGVSSFHAAMTTGLMSATRPAHFFRPDGDQPDAIDVPIYRPRGFVDMTTSEWRTLVQGRVRTTELAHRERRRGTGKSVLGRSAILTQAPSDSPVTGEQHFNINPRIAARDKWARIAALRRSKAFLESYLSAIKSWMAGLANVVFPYGTYWMRRFAHVLCTSEETAPAESQLAEGLAAT